MKWVIVVPIWGTWHHDLFARAMLPSLNVALAEVEGPHRFIIHTNEPDRIRKLFGDNADKVEALSLFPGLDQYVCFGKAHREGLEMAQVGEAVALLPADIIVSRECFAASERQFKDTKKSVRVVGIHGIRTVIDPATVKPGMIARELLDLAVRYLHPSVHHGFWHMGFSGHNSAVYFTSRSGLTAHVFHMHPFALLKEADRPSFASGTVDQNLMADYGDEEIHIVTSADEMSVAEISPPMKQHPHARHLFVNQARVIEWACGANRVSAQQCRFFARAIQLYGDADGSEEESAVKEILAILKERL